MVWVLGVVCVAMLVRGTLGFGDALVGMPLLLLVAGLEIDVAAPLVALLSVMLAGIVLWQDWRRVRFRDAGMLIASALLGIIAGLLILDRVDSRYVTGLLGVVLMTYSGYSFWRAPRWRLKSERAAPLFGIIAGVLSGAYNTAGPPLVVYGALRRWSAEQFRATLQAFFLPTGLAVVAGHAVMGRLTEEVFIYFAAGIPIVLVCVAVGRRINARFRTESFARFLHGFLVLMGALLLSKAVWRFA